MINTDIGSLDGDKWEGLIQSVFKRKYDTYQEMIASPGDLGIEGFVLDEGILIQCYCPDKEYDTGTLHEKQRDKITKDIGKLEKYQASLVRYFGSTMIKQWIFITPRIAKHEIHAHARTKEAVLQSYKLSFISQDCRILVKDLDHYISDIRQIQTINGEKLSFSRSTYGTLPSPLLTTKYDENIIQKNEIRSIVNNKYNSDTHDRLNYITKKNYLYAYSVLKSIHMQSPELYERISKLVNIFEDEVEEHSSTWEDSPRNLLTYVEDKLMARLEKDPYISKIEHEDLNIIVKHMVSRWIAECPMRIIQ